MVGGQSEASSGSSVSIGDPQVKALLEMLAQGGVVTKPTMGLSEAQRFHGEHYSTWRLKFIRRAKEVGLWEYYRPDEKGDEAERAAKSEEEKMEFKKRSKLAFFQLCHSVADGIAVGLDGFAELENSAQAAWAYMESTYLGHMDANIADVRKKLLLMTMEPNQKIIDYVNMARSYNDDLTAMGEPETERAMIGHIVNGLPEDWSGERPALICHPPENMTKLIAMLQALERARDHQKRREKFTKDVEQEKPALVNAAAAGRSVGACYQCGKMGHKAFECAENPRSRNYKGNGAGWSGAQQNGAGNGRGSKGKFNGACHHCKKIGHRAIDCYSNPNSRSYRGPQQQGSAPPKANAPTAPTAAENDKEDAILGGAHKANVARASGVCMLAKGGGAGA
ncbi:unnamed protein product [Closterium sp. NIES-53]